MIGGLPAAAAAALVLLAAPAMAQIPELAVSAVGAEDAPGYLAVHAAAALGTFEAEGVRVSLRRARHPVAAAAALRDGDAAVAVTTTDQAIRVAWARELPVRVLVAHTRAPAVALLASAKRRGEITGVEDLRGQRVGIPAPGTTSHLVLAALLRAQRIEPWQVQLQSVGGPALLGRLASGELAAAVVEEPWVSRTLAVGAATMLLDLRRPEEAGRLLGGPFYEIVSVTPAADKALAERTAALVAYARAVIRVQAWLAGTAPEAIADRLPASLVGNRERFVDRLRAVQAAYAPDGAATEAGLAATLAVLQAGSPWPVTLKLTPKDLLEPPFVSAARAALGPTPPAP